MCIRDSAHTIKLATSASHASSLTAINISAVGGGTSHTLNAAFDGVNKKFRITHGSGTRARFSHASQLRIAINNVIQKANNDYLNFSEGYAIEVRSIIVFQTAPTVNDIFFGTLLGETLGTFDITNHKIDNYTGDGSTTLYNLSQNVPNNESLLVSLNGVIQHPTTQGTTRSYTLVSGTTNRLQFTTAPALGVEIQIRHLGFAGASSGDVSGFYGRTGNVGLTASDNITTGNINSSGIITATSFVGSGANLTGIDATSVKDSAGNVKIQAQASGAVYTGIHTFTGDVSIGGTLTYEDVKNLDAVGLGTFREGLVIPDNKKASFGTDDDGSIKHTGTNLQIFETTGNIQITNYANDKDVVISSDDGSGGTASYFKADGSTGEALLYHYGNEKIKTTSTGVSITGNNVVSGDLDVDGHTNLDNVSVAGVTTFAGIIEGIQGQNKIPSLYGAMSDLPSASSYHGMFAHVHATARGYFAHAGNWLELVNKESNGTVGTGTETYNIGGITATGLDLNGNLDVDLHTNLDNVNIAGVTTTTGLLDIDGGGRANTFKVEDLTSGRVVFAGSGGELEDSNNLRFDGSNLFVSGINVVTSGGAASTSIIGEDITTRNLRVTGISTFNGAVQFDSTIKVGGSNGTNGNYLKSTGTGVAWDSFPSLRTRQTFTASSGQTAFSFAYTVGFLDVYVNGIKLTDSEFTATNGSTTVLAVGCFVGDIVELVAYNTVSAGGGAFGIGNVVEDLSPQLGGNLDLFNKTVEGTGSVNMTGVVTATKFVGDGSGLTGVTASGSGLIVKDSGTLVGTAQTIDFGANLSLSPISSGMVTITAAAGGGSTTNVRTNSLNVIGISTLAGITTVTGTTLFAKQASVSGVVSATTFVGALTGTASLASNLTGSPSIEVTDIDVDGHTNLDNVCLLYTSPSPRDATLSRMPSSA